MSSKCDNLDRKLQPADQQAQAFERVREAHQMEATEDYVELIDDLITSQGEARLVEIGAIGHITTQCQ